MAANTARAQDAFFWLEQAKRLDAAAMLIWAGIQKDLAAMSKLAPGATVTRDQVPNAYLGGVFWLNAGLALENLLKGIIVKRDPKSAANGRLARHLKTHNLLELCDRAGAKLSESEAFYLCTATRCVQWTGRYPTSTSGEGPEASVFSESDVLAYRALFDRLAGDEDFTERRVVIFSRVR